MTPIQDRAIEALLTPQGRGVSAANLARLMGLRPASRHRLGVTSALRGLIGRGVDINPGIEWRGKWVRLSRLAPKDQWGVATWWADIVGE